MEEIFIYIIQNISEEISLQDLAAQAGLEKFKFLKAFRDRYHITPMKLLWKFRAHLAAEVMKMNPHMSITDVTFLCGYTSASHFTRAFKEEHKKVPRDFCSDIKKTKLYFKISPDLVSDVASSTRYPIALFTLEETLSQMCA